MKIFVYLWNNDLPVYFIWVLFRFFLSHLTSYEDINIKFTSVLGDNSAYTVRIHFLHGWGGFLCNRFYMSANDISRGSNHAFSIIDPLRIRRFFIAIVVRPTTLRFIKFDSWLLHHQNMIKIRYNLRENIDLDGRYIYFQLSIFHFPLSSRSSSF